LPVTELAALPGRANAARALTSLELIGRSERI